MKKIVTLLLILSMVLGMFSGCANETDNSAYVPTGDAILMEGQDPEDIQPEEEEDQALYLAYYPDLKGINALALRRAGVRHIEISDSCTWCESDRFWSHRVTKGDRGSQGAIITCKEGTE